MSTDEASPSDTSPNNLLSRILIDQEISRAQEIQLFNALLNDSVDGVVLGYPPTGQILYANPAICRMSGYTEAELIAGGRNLIFDQNNNRLKSMLRQVHEHGHARGEVHLTCKSGTKLDVEVVSSKVEIPNNTQIWSIFIRDISERKATERERAVLVEQVSDAIIAVDNDLLITAWNRAAEKIYGYMVDDVIGKHLLSLLQTKYIDTTRQIVHQTILETGFWKGEVKQRTKSGEVLDIEVSVSLIKNEDGEPAGGVGVSRNISDRRIAERRRLEHQRKSQEMQRLESLTLLAGGVAHDINNLLTPIFLNTRLISKKGELTPDILRRLETIETVSKKIKGIVQQMLSFAGNTMPELSRFDVNEMVRGIEKLIPSLIPKNVALEIALAPIKLLIEGDRTQLEQVLINLIINASESYGGNEGAISIQTIFYASESDLQQSKKRGRMELIVRDRGPGIDQDALPNIFDPFFSTKATGRGLGLAAAQGIIQTHAGEIKVESQIGVGTTFIITLPVQKEEVDLHLPETVTEFKENLEGHLWLIIDDEKPVRLAITDILREVIGVSTLQAADGETGLTMADQHQAELSGVILDLTMPGMDGRIVYQRLRKKMPTLPVILISGYSEHEVEDLLDDPHVSFLHKPFDVHALQTLIGRLM